MSKLMSSAPLNVNKLLYRACHRGTAEMDFLVGGFAKAQIKRLGDNDLASLAVLLDMPDPTLESLIWGRSVLETTDPLEKKLGAILIQIQDYHSIIPNKKQAL